MLLIYLFIFMCLLFYICRMVDFVYGSYLIIIILCYLLIEMFYCVKDFIFYYYVNNMYVYLFILLKYILFII